MYFFFRNLADLDSDGALNFEEFCIAMHIVVAVRHGLDVPATLPQYLIPEKYETQGNHFCQHCFHNMQIKDSEFCTEDLVCLTAAAPQIVETNSSELSLQDSSQVCHKVPSDRQNVGLL